ncbi:FAD-binding oxidoreductase [Nocardia pseudobrasiliensis]|nr:FAD-binding oxidoreductase [Nocardia pseudobrasiliensis]
MGEIVNKTSRDYQKARSAWNSLYRTKPDLIIYPTNAEEVAAALAHARHRGLDLRIRSGGHSFDGYSSVDGGVVLDLGRMDSIVVRDDDTVVIGPGARLRTVYEVLSDYDLALPGGNCGGVGVGGLTLGGGLGILGRTHGWLAQSVRSVDMIDARGNLITVDKDNHPDLFWALRGSGGGNFGIVVSFTFQAYRIPHLVRGVLHWDWDHLVDFADALQQFGPTMDRRINMIGHLECKQVGTIALIVVSLASRDETERALAPMLAALPPVRDQQYATVRYVDAAQDSVTPELLYSNEVRATTVTGNINETLSRDCLQKIKDRLAVAESGTTIQLHALGSVTAELNRTDPIALPSVDGLLSLFAPSYWTDPAADEFNLNWMSGLAEDMLPHFQTTYINSNDIHIDDRIYPRYGENFARLVKIKNQYDPENVFTFAAGIPPSLTRPEAERMGLPEHQIQAIQEFGFLNE